MQGSSINYIISDFVILDPPVHADTLLAYTPSPKYQCTDILFQRRYDRDFVNDYQSKDHKQVAKYRNYYTRVSGNVESKHQEEPWD